MKFTSRGLTAGGLGSARNRILGASAVAIAAAMVLSACSSSSKTAATTPAGTTSGSSSAPSTSAAATDCASGTLKGEGSTAQTNAIQQWIKDFQAKCPGATINYNPTGSGAGVKQFNGNQVDFAGSDSALSPTAGEVAAAAKRCASPALDLPMVVGPIAIALKVKGVDDAALTLTPVLIAKIFLGKITKWSDPAIKAINSGVTLPDEAINVFFRSDSSGTTQNFEKYLAATDPADFTETPAKTWPGKVGQGKSGSQGVQQALSGSEGGIAYLEWSFAVNANLATAKVDNGGGAVALDADTASAAVASATVTGTGNDVTLKLDYATKTAGAYPLILVTYEIACTKYADPKVGAQVKAFLTYTSGDGQAGLKDLGYAPIPDSIKAKVTAAVAQIS